MEILRPEAKMEKILAWSQDPNISDILCDYYNVVLYVIPIILKFPTNRVGDV